MKSHSQKLLLFDTIECKQKKGHEMHRFIDSLYYFFYLHITKVCLLKDPNDKTGDCQPYGQFKCRYAMQSI